MRSIYSILLVLISSYGWSQSNTPSVPPSKQEEIKYVNSTNSSVNSVSAEEKLNIVTDSTVIISTEDQDKGRTLKEVETKANKDVKASSKKATPYKRSDMDAEGYTASPSAPQESKTKMETMSTGFYTTKTQSSTQRTQRTPSEEQQLKMDETVKYFETFAPESFEYHYYKYVAGNYNVGLIEHLKKAYELKPNNADIQIQLAAYYIITEDTANTKVFLTKIKEIGRISEDATTYAKDLMISVPENGTLITHGFDDMYSCEYLQNILKIRPDVQLISLDFLQSEVYRNQLTKKGYILPKETVVNTAYLSSFCALNESKTISISLTTPKEYFQDIKQKIYVVGLTFEYHSSVFSNFYYNDYLWNEKLEKTLVYNSLNEKSKQLSANYLPMLLKLREVYMQQKEMDKVAKIDEAIDKVSVQCKKYEQVQKLKKSY